MALFRSEYQASSLNSFRGDAMKKRFTTIKLLSHYISILEKRKQKRVDATTVTRPGSM